MNIPLLQQFDQIRMRAQEVFDQGDSGNSFSLLKECCEEAKTTCGETSPEYGLTVQVLGSAYYKYIDDYQNALNCYYQSLGILEQHKVEPFLIFHILMAYKALIELNHQLKNSDDTQKEIEALTTFLKALPPGEIYKNIYHITEITKQLLNIAPQRSYDLYDSCIITLKRIPSRELMHILMPKAQLAKKLNDIDVAQRAYAEVLKIYETATVNSTLDFTDLDYLCHISKLFEKYDTLATVGQHIRDLYRSGTDGKSKRNFFEGVFYETEGFLVVGPDAERKGKLYELLQLSISEFGEGSIEVIRCRFLEASFLFKKQKYPRAIDILEMIIPLCRPMYHLKSELFGDIQLLLADCYDLSGNPKYALTNYENAWQLYANILGQASPKTVSAIYGIGEMLRITNDEQAALSYFKIAMNIQVTYLGRLTPMYAKLSNDMGAAYLFTGEYEEAEKYISEALSVKGQLYGNHSNNYAQSLYLMANLYVLKDKITEALSLLDEIDLFITEDRRIQFNGLKAQCLSKTGNYDQAIELWKTSLECFNENPDTNRNNIITVSYDIALAYKSLPDDESCKQYLFFALEKDLARIIIFLSNASRDSLRASIREFREKINMGLVISVISSSWTIDDKSLIYSYLQKSKSLETRILAMQKKSFLNKPGVEGYGERINELFAERHELKKEQLLQWIRQENADGHPNEGNIQEKIERNERFISQLMGTTAREMEINFSSVSVPAESAVLEYHAVVLPDEKDMMSYLLFVTLPSGVFHRFEITEYDQVNSGIIELLKTINAVSSRWRSKGTFLFNKLLKPALPLLETVKEIYIVTDGLLSSLPFELLPLTKNELLIDKWVISYLGYAAELHRSNLHFGNVELPGESLIISSPDYGKTETGSREPASFSILPFAQKEASFVAETIAGRVIQNDQVNKNITQLASPEIIHFCTHSFYVPLKQGENTTTTLPTLLAKMERFKDALDRSGIALYLANNELNNPQTYFYTGILYGSEISDWDLRATELVVLSSCQSATGDLAYGDGMQGLRKAFKLAGVKSVICSLWKVSDEATFRLMELFYTNLFQKQSKAEALRNAKRRLSYDFPHPFFWAGFIADGNMETLTKLSKKIRVQYRYYG